MPLTDWRLQDLVVLFVQLLDERTESGRLTAYASAAELARAHHVRALVIQPRPIDALAPAPSRLRHHDALAVIIAASGVRIYIHVAPRGCPDARHHVFAAQRAGLLARQSPGREGAITLARRLCRNQAEHGEPGASPGSSSSAGP